MSETLLHVEYLTVRSLAHSPPQKLALLAAIKNRHQQKNCVNAAATTVNSLLETTL